MRQRVLRPTFFTNEELAQLSALVRLLFQGLWCASDREGRLEDRPGRLKVEILPFDRIDMNAALQELHDGGFITRYEAEGARFIQVNAFLSHQRPHPNEPSLKIPPAQSLTAMPRKAIAGHCMSRPAMTKTPGSSGSSLTGSTGSSVPPPTPSAPENGASRSTALSEFAVFWGSWLGERTGKGKAEEKFIRARKRGVALETMLAALDRLERSRDAKAARGEFVPEYPHPATWLNQRRWEDGGDTGPAPSPEVEQEPREYLFNYLEVLRTKNPGRYRLELDQLHPDIRAAWEARIATDKEAPCPPN